MEVRALKEILKPTTGKVVMFLVLMLIVVILPLYPTDYMQGRIDYIGAIHGGYPGITLQPLVFVIQGDFQWSESVEYSAPINSIDLNTYVADYYEYSANPAYLILYIPYAILAYIIGCFLVQYLAWWKNKKGNIKQIKDF